MEVDDEILEEIKKDRRKKTLTKRNKEISQKISKQRDIFPNNKFEVSKTINNLNALKIILLNEKFFCCLSSKVKEAEKILIINSKTMGLEFEITLDKNGIHNIILLLSNGDLLVSNIEENICIFSLNLVKKKYKLLKKIKNIHHSFLTNIILIDTEKFPNKFITSSSNGMIKIYNEDDFECIHIIFKYIGYINIKIIGKYLLINDDNGLYFCDIETFKEKKFLPKLKFNYATEYNSKVIIAYENIIQIINMKNFKIEAKIIGNFKKIQFPDKNLFELPKKHFCLGKKIKDIIKVNDENFCVCCVNEIDGNEIGIICLINKELTILKEFVITDNGCYSVCKINEKTIIVGCDSCLIVINL